MNTFAARSAARSSDDALPPGTPSGSNKTDFEMALIGLGAAVLDILFVASIVLLLRFSVPVSVGLAMDLLLVLLIVDGFLLLLYGKRAHQFMSRSRPGIPASSNSGPKANCEAEGPARALPTDSRRSSTGNSQRILPHR